MVFQPKDIDFEDSLIKANRYCHLVEVPQVVLAKQFDRQATRFGLGALIAPRASSGSDPVRCSASSPLRRFASRAAAAA